MNVKAVAHRLVLLIVHLQELHIRVPLRELTNLRKGRKILQQHDWIDMWITLLSVCSWYYLGVESMAASAAGWEEVDDDEPVAGVGQGIGEVLGGLDRPHVGLQSLLPPLHGFRKWKVRLLKRRSSHVKTLSTCKFITILTKQNNFITLNRGKPNTTKKNWGLWRFDNLHRRRRN